MVQIELFAVAVLFTIIQARPLEEIRQRDAWLHRNANGWDEEVLPWEVMDDTTKKSLQHSNDIITKSLTSLYPSESDPTNGRILKIYNKWRGLLAMDKNGKIYAAATGESREVLFKQLVYSYENGKYKVRLQSVEYSKYVAISCSTGKVYSTSNENNPETVLIYSPDVAHGDTFQSEKCSQGSSMSWYLGIRKDRKNMKNAKTASASDKGTRFLIFST